MRKIILTLSIILACLLLLTFLFVLALRYWFNPNTLVAPLSSQIQQKTGLVLRVEGKLSWHIFPRAHITVEQLSLQPTNPKKNTTDIRIQTLRANLSLWPLITDKKLVIDDITLDGLELTIQPNSLQTLKKSSALPATSASSPRTKKSIGFAIKSITLSNATLHGVLESVRPNATLYLDHFTVQNLDSSAGVRAMPIEMVARIVSNGNTLPLSLNSTVLFDATKHSISTADLQARINTLTIQGNLNAKKISENTQWQGQLTLDDKNAANTVQLLAGTNNTFIKTLQGTLTLAANQQKIDLPTFTLKLNGDALTGSATYDLKQHRLDSMFNADTLHYKNLVLNNIKGQLQYADQSISLNPITVTVLQGLYQGKIALTLDNASNLMIDGTLSHLDLALLQQSLGAKPSVTGLLNAKGALSSQGQSQKQRLANLNGNISLVINKGSWTKLNMSNILGLLNLASGKQSLSAGDGFSSVSGDFAIHNGVGYNPNLRLMSPLLTAKGDGTLNLVAQTLHYSVMLHPDPSVLQQVNGLAQWLKQDIPLTIKGPWANPNIQLDQGALIKTKVEGSLNDTLKKVRGLIILQ